MSNVWIYDLDRAPEYEAAKAKLCVQHPRADEITVALEWDALTSAVTVPRDEIVTGESLPAPDCPALRVFYVVSGAKVLMVGVEII